MFGIVDQVSLAGPRLPAGGGGRQRCDQDQRARHQSCLQVIHYTVHCTVYNHHSLPQIDFQSRAKL